MVNYRRTKLLMIPMMILAHNLDLALSNKCHEVIIQCKDFLISHLIYRNFFIYDHILTINLIQPSPGYKPISLI